MLKYVLVILLGIWLRRFGLALGLFGSIIPKKGFEFDETAFWRFKDSGIHLKTSLRKAIFLT